MIFILFGLSNIGMLFIWYKHRNDFKIKDSETMKLITNAYESIKSLGFSQSDIPTEWNGTWIDPENFMTKVNFQPYGGFKYQEYSNDSEEFLNKSTGKILNMSNSLITLKTNSHQKIIINQQPKISKDKTWTIVLNGKTYVKSED